MFLAPSLGRSEEHTPPRLGWIALLATHTADRPEGHEVIAGIRAVADELPDRMQVGLRRGQKNEKQGSVKGTPARLTLKRDSALASQPTHPWSPR